MMDDVVCRGVDRLSGPDILPILQRDADEYPYLRSVARRRRSSPETYSFLMPAIRAPRRRPHHVRIDQGGVEGWIKPAVSRTGPRRPRS